MATERKSEKEGGEKEQEEEACPSSEEQRLEVMHSLSYSATLREIVRRGLLDQVEAKVLINMLDRDDDEKSRDSFLFETVRKQVHWNRSAGGRRGSSSSSSRRGIDGDD